MTDNKECNLTLEQAENRVRNLSLHFKPKGKVKLLDTVWLPRPSNKRRGCFPLGFDKYIPQLLRTENYIHFFSGYSKKGFTVDIDPECKPDLVANVEYLPQIKDESYEGAIGDPPYNEDFAKLLYNCDYPKWSNWTKEIVRVTKKGGYIAIMQNYVVPRLPKCKYVEIFPILTRIKQFPKIVTVQRRVK